MISKFCFPIKLLNMPFGAKSVGFGGSGPNSGSLALPSTGRSTNFGCPKLYTGHGVGPPHLLQSGMMKTDAGDRIRSSMVRSKGVGTSNVDQVRRR